MASWTIIVLNTKHPKPFKSRHRDEAVERYRWAEVGCLRDKYDRVSVKPDVTGGTQYTYLLAEDPSGSFRAAAFKSSANTNS